MSTNEKALSGETVDAVIVGGIGAGAIRKLGSMGIKTFKAIDGDLEENLKAFNNGTLKEFSANHTCNHDGCSLLLKDILIKIILINFYINLNV